MSGDVFTCYVNPWMENEFRGVFSAADEDRAKALAEAQVSDYFGKPVEWAQEGENWKGRYNEEAHVKGTIFLYREKVQT